MMIRSRISLIYLLNDLPRSKLPHAASSPPRYGRPSRYSVPSRWGFSGDKDCPSQGKGNHRNMAATFSCDALRDLAGFRAGKGVAVSFYLDLDPSLTPAAGDLATRTNSLLADADRHIDRSHLNHDQRKSLTADLERIRGYIESELVRDGAHGLAVFTDDLDNLWRPLTLTESVPDAVKINAELYLTPLEQLAKLTEHQPRRHDQGGWSQANYQRHADHLVQEHLHDVASELDRLVRRGNERV